MRYVIIGNSAAAVHAIEEIRKIDTAGELVVFSREPYLAYSRPLITEFLFDGIPERKMAYRDAAFYRKHAVDLRLGVEVVEIDRKKREVLDSEGERTQYDKLLLTAGGVPFVPPLKGGDKENIFTMMTWDSARQVKESITKIGHAVVLGGGLIGMKTAEGIFEAGVKTTVVELAPQILSRILDYEGARIFEDYLQQRGMEIITGDTVTEVIGDRSVSGVLLRSKREIPCDMIVVAIGVAPNTEIAEKSGIETNRGVLVNENMQTSDPDVFAAGDIAESYDIIVDEVRVNAIWPLASQQGRIAGANMAGGSLAFSGGFPKNSISLLGLETISMGHVDPPDDSYEVISKIDRTGYKYRKFILKDGYVSGGIFIGDIEKAGIITGLIKNRVHLEGDVSWLLSGVPQLIWLDKAYRDDKLRKRVLS